MEFGVDWCTISSVPLCDWRLVSAVFGYVRCKTARYVLLAILAMAERQTITVGTVHMWLLYIVGLGSGIPELVGYIAQHWPTIRMLSIKMNEFTSLKMYRSLEQMHHSSNLVS